MSQLDRNAEVRRLTYLGMCFLSFALLAGCKGPNLTPDPAYARAVAASESSQGIIQQMSAATASTEKSSDEPAPDAPHSPHRRTCCKSIRKAFTKPWYGNYLGPDNYGYDKQPIDELDAAARQHDLAYDQCNAVGLAGALWNLNAGKADLELAKRAFQALPSLDFQGKLMGVATGVTMGFLGAVKEPLAELRRALHHRSPPAS
jgi:hypothetical protein